MSAEAKRLKAVLSKYLKLNARHEDARRVAQCLVGSHCFIPRESGQRFCELHGIVSNHYFSVIVGEGSVECPMDENGDSLDIFIRLDQLKLCLFTAMREQLLVNTGHIDGTISKLDNGYCSIYTSNGVTDRIPLRDISLALRYIELGKLEGCEIVEM